MQKLQINSMLDKIVEEHGIDILRKYIKRHNKKQRTRKPRKNTYVDVALTVYSLMSGDEKYSRKKAFEEAEKIHNCSNSTVNGHCSKFDKQAYKLDYITFAKTIENNISYQDDLTMEETIDINADSKKITSNLANALYCKYKADKYNDNLKYDEIMACKHDNNFTYDEENPVPF